MPRRYDHFLAPVACVLVVVIAVGGVVLAWGQHSPGPGTWDDRTTTVTGTTASAAASRCSTCSISIESAYGARARASPDAKNAPPGIAPGGAFSPPVPVETGDE